MATSKSIIICGRSGAGKWTVCKYLIEKTDGIIYQLSSISRKILQEFDIPETRESFSKISSLIRSLFWENIFAEMAVKFRRENTKNIIIFDGVRRKNVIHTLKEEGNCIVIFIDTKTPIRYERIIKRGEKHNEASLGFEEFLEEEKLKSEVEIDSIKDIADIVIENNGTEQELKQQLDTLFNEFYQK